MLQKQIGMGTPEEEARLQRMQAKINTKHLLSRDPNGFRQILLALTAPGAGHMFASYCPYTGD